MSEVIYRHKSGLILIEENVVRILNNWRQIGRQSEAGGILIGYRRPPHIHVIACTTPCKKDKRTRSGFMRQDPNHSVIAREHWKNSSGQAYYLGEWHTHPIGIPTPSSVDRKEWSKLRRSRLGSQLLFIIVGRSQWYGQFGVQSLDRKKLDIQV